MMTIKNGTLDDVLRCGFQSFKDFAEKIDADISKGRLFVTVSNSKDLDTFYDFDIDYVKARAYEEIAPDLPYPGLKSLLLQMTFEYGSLRKGDRDCLIKIPTKKFTL